MKIDFNNLWDEDLIQFARFIDEAQASGHMTLQMIESMAASMDLDEERVWEIVERAQKVWEDLKILVRDLGQPELEPED